MRNSVLKLFAEIRRRKVFQTFVPYLGLVWLILQVVSVVAPIFNLSPLFSTLVAVVLFAGLPIVLYLSWYFDLTMEGLVAVPDADSDETSSFGIIRWTVLLLITFGSGLLAYRYFSTVQIEFAKANDGIQQTFIADSIAVLPFEDASSDQDQGYLGQGLAEEITSLLGRTSGLKVAASSSTAILAERGLDPVTIARRLDVLTILSGSVRVTGDQLKIRVELVNAADARVLWSEIYARKFSDIFSVESEIARSTVNMLQDTYIQTGSLTNTATTKSTDAYVMYLKGREQYRLQTTESIKQARQYFEQAIALDPEYAEAYVGLADSIVLLSKGLYTFGSFEPEIAAQMANASLSKALVRDQSIARAYAIQGKVFELQQQSDRALSAYDKAISLNPNMAIAYMWRFNELQRQNRYDEAFESLKIAAKLDPISIATQYNLGYEYFRRADYPQARLQFEQLTKDFPKSPMGYKGLAGVAYNQGQLANSLQYWHKALSISPEDINFQQQYLSVLLQLKMVEPAKNLTDDESYQATFLLLSGQYDKLFKLMDFQVAANPDDAWVQFEAAWYQMLVGDHQRGIDLLLKAYPHFSEQELFAMPYCSPGIEIAWALQQSQQLELANAIINQCTKQVESASLDEVNSIYVYLQARLAALKGNNASALSLLDVAIEAGWLEWWTSKDPILSSIHNTADAQALFQHIDDTLNQQSQAATAFLQQQQTKDLNGAK
jgi:TolB-like protein/predicted Zn-dependent protease